MIHITRRTNWFDKGNDIAPEEWRKLLDEDPELEFVDKVEGKSQDETKFEYDLSGSTLAKWIHPATHNTIWFNHHEGTIDISNPDEKIMNKAREIAIKMNAKIQGDELETY